jgi:hypothetical protein
MTRPSVANVVQLALWSLVLIWLSTTSIAKLAERYYGKAEQRVLTYAESQRVRANHAEQRADSLANARSVKVAETRVRTVYVQQQAKALPPAVTPSDTARDAIISQQNALIVDLNDAIDTGLQVEAALRGALKAESARGDSLLAFIQRPKPKASRVVLGVFVGPCMSEQGASRVCVGAGIGIKL